MTKIKDKLLEMIDGQRQEVISRNDEDDYFDSVAVLKAILHAAIETNDLSESEIKFTKDLLDKTSNLLNAIIVFD